MDWRLKAAVFRLFEIIPLGEKIHFWAQRKITRTWPRPAEDVASLIAAAANNIADFNRLSDTPLEHATFFEIGAGRDLVLPIALRMLKVGRVVTTDIQRLANLELVNASAAIAANLLGAASPKFSSWSELRDFGVHYVAPFDAERDILPPMDAFISNEVLEHIPADALRSIFRRIADHLPAGGVSIHAVDYSDHYARGSNLSRYNFLQFTDEQWQRFNPGAHYVNRLRHCQCKTIIEQAGFNMIEEQTYSEEMPRGFKLAPEFSRIDPDSVRVLRARMCSIKPRNQEGETGHSHAEPEEAYLPRLRLVAG